MDWYYVDNGQQVGPLAERDFAQAVQRGKVLPTTLVWHSGLGNWQPYSAVASAPQSAMTQTATQPAPTTTCMECGGAFAQSDMVRYGDKWICAACKPAFIQKLKEGLRPGERLQYAGFWIRVSAKMIDIILSLVLHAGFQFAFGLAMTRNLDNESMLYALMIGQQLVSFAIGIGYSVYFVGKYGATPGKLACRIMIVSDGEGAVGYGRAFGRFWAEVLSSMILGIGYLMVAWDPERRALHDRLCNTRVVYR